MRTPLSVVQRYWLLTAGWSELLFLVLAATLSVGLSMIAGYGLTQLGIPQAERPELLRYGAVGLFTMAVLVAPPIETLLFQQLPISLARRFGLPGALQLAIGSIPFAAAHFSSGIIVGIAAGVVGGLLYSSVYLTFVSQSKKKAFAMTTAVHCMHNLIVGAAYLHETSGFSGHG